MKTEINILYLEDAPTDVVLVNHELRKGGLLFRTRRVDSREAFTSALEEQDAPDVILSDHGLPAFDGFHALALARDKCPDVPFIFVSDAFPDGAALEPGSGDAADCVPKKNLSRLVPALHRALRHAKVQGELRACKRHLRECEERFTRLSELARDCAVVLLDSNGRVIDWNRAAKALHDYTPAEAVGRHLSLFYTLEDIDAGRPEFALRTAADEGRFQEEGLRLAKGGRTFHAEVQITALRDASANLCGFALVTRDITTRKHAEEDARSSRLLMDAVLQTAPDAIIFMNYQGTVMEWNPAAEKIFGYSRVEAIGREMAELIIPPSLREEHRAGLAGYLETGATRILGQRLEMRAQRSNGEEFQVELTVTRAPGIEPAVFAAYIRDTAEQKRTESELRRVNACLERRVVQRTERLGEVNRELESFATAVSHDLRAPLRHIAGYAEMLAGEATWRLDPTSRRYLDCISNAAGSASTLIEALVSLLRIGRTEMEIRPFSLADSVEAARSELRPELDGRMVEWKTGEMPEVVGDPVLIRRAIVNLLHNALKFTRKRPQASIATEARVTDSETIFAVRDNGIGFDMKFAPKLFGAFQRLHSQDEFDGIGMGLATARRIIHRHGGRTWAEGAVDGGATFYFSLPRQDLASTTT